MLLLVVGPSTATTMMRRLATTHLRDATRSGCEALMELLPLLQPILEEAAPKLASLVTQLQLPPYFALRWFITWFSHDMHDLNECARLFDLFLASHPMMPLYVGAVAMRSQAQALLGCEEMPELHSKLVNLDITHCLSADALASQVGMAWCQDVWEGGTF